VKKVEELVEKSPQNLKVVVGQIEELFGRKISVKTLQRLLKKKVALEAI
jgi:transposase